MGCVTAPPGALTETPDGISTPEEPSAAAFGLLSRAQALADHLRLEVKAEVAALRAEASAAHDEARRLLIDATSVHDDALSAQRSAQARLQEAQQEAAQLVADAADQATLVADAADRTTESLLANTQVEADEIRGAAKAEDLRLRALATTEFEQVREKSTALLSEAAARIESRQIQVTAELQQLGGRPRGDLDPGRCRRVLERDDLTGQHRSRHNTRHDDAGARPGTGRDRQSQVDRGRRDRIGTRWRDCRG
jgi:hypothetical protein